MIFLYVLMLYNCSFLVLKVEVVLFVEVLFKYGVFLNFVDKMFCIFVYYVGYEVDVYRWIEMLE